MTETMRSENQSVEPATVEERLATLERWATTVTERLAGSGHLLATLPPFGDDPQEFWRPSGTE